eukprot:CAMPEP_0181112156 /NCGR_PEP_ID=MMETSP1071-20121207/19666_1 /TAXON_ID=35127 /ORGANISM="Thalassiosira sp., Strain NH16" /LENGTH=753 /DNA_ID=CAMNT_0023196113 /DNA_START=505 /DNA_END=2763 /DNA_ORIENTATION=-
MVSSEKARKIQANLLNEGTLPILPSADGSSCGDVNEKGSKATTTNDTNPKEDESFTQFNVVNDLVSISERLLDNLDTYPPREKSYSSLSRLSKAHHSMMAKTSNMRRQRFVTGKYPLYVSVKQNPTLTWLGLAESQIYLNGTSIENSLASYDIFHWLDDEERRKLHGDYEFLSLELLAEIHMKNPGYVNILPKGGAGMSLTQSEEDDGIFGKWKSWKLRDDPSTDENKNLKKNEDGERLWVTGFSLTKQRGELHTVDVESGVMANVNERTAKAIKWPNEVSSIPRHMYANQINHEHSGGMKALFEDALLVTDGFLVPGKDKGGLYVVRNPGNSESEWRVCLSGVTNLQGATINAGESDWFYHRAIWLDMTGDGRQSILAARAKLPLFKGNEAQEDGGSALGKGQLVWLECPKPYSFDANTGTPLDVDGTVFDPFRPRNAPWKLRVLDEGPDVMFNVADLDPSDETIEVIASQFFSKKLSLHSIQLGPKPKVVYRRVIDERCGAAFSSVLADLDGLATREQAKGQPHVIDSGSTVESLKGGDSFSHLLVTSHECSFAEGSSEVKSKIGEQIANEEQSDFDSPATTGIHAEYTDQSKIDGGSLFAYRVPAGKDAWKTEPWPRSIVATGFKVNGQLSNMINPGAPGFCYTFFPTREGGLGKDKIWHRPLIGLSGDCAESAYILRPIESASTSHGGTDNGGDISTKYALMCEIKCKSTVGSLAIGYDDLHSAAAEQQSGYAKIYIPCYEQDKVLVFS